MRKPKKLLSLILTAAILLSLMPATVFAADTFSDTSGHWAADAIKTWTRHDVLSGYPNGEFKPNAPITRAELAAVLNRVMGYTKAADNTFTDVPAGEWYTGDIAKLYAAGIMAGDGNGIMRPTANITREEAAVMIARAFAVEENARNENPFPDAAQISGWAALLVDGMKSAGYINGDNNGNFNPKAPITRAEVVTILDNIVDAYYNIPGEHENVTARNIVIRSADVTLTNSTITRNLYITEGVANGNVTLENCTVANTLYIRGGSNGIHINGGSYDTIVLDSTSVALSDVDTVKRVYIKATGSVMHNSMTVNYSAWAGTLTFGGMLDVVELNSDGSSTVTVDGVTYDVIPPPGTLPMFALAPGSVVKQMITNGAASVSGTGKIDKMTVHENGVVIDKSVNVRPQDIFVDDGVKITVAGKDYTGESKALPPNTTPGGNSSGGNSSGGSTTTPTTYNMTLGVVPGYGASNWVSIDQGNPTGNAQGAAITITATPDTGHIFVGWVETSDRTAAIVSTDAVYTFDITKNTTLYAIFNGDGSTNPIEIATEAEFVAIHSDPNVLTNHYKLLNDITLTSAWKPIGDDDAPFIGTFDGSGHTITFENGVTIVRDTAGLFGEIGFTATVRNLTVAGNISASPHPLSTATIGGIVGYNDGTIENCAMLGDVTMSGGTSNYVGGIVGMSGNGATIKNCYSLGTVSVSGNNYNLAGGIAGANSGTITNSYSGGDIISSGGSLNYVGGIAGWGEDGTVRNCYSNGNISAIGGQSTAGGIVGESNPNGTITYCYATGAVSASGVAGIAGGIAGTSTNSTTNCVALNSRVSVSGVSHIGRIAGISNGTLSDNRAIAMGTLPDGAHNDPDGATIGTGDVLAADFWNDDTSGIWKDVFASYPSDTNPWVVADGELPHLYWQATSPATPDHFVVGARTDNPILVSDAAGLAAIADGLDKHYKLLNDINVGTNWTPIGSTSATAFTGSLNGNGHTVTIGGIASGLAVEAISGGNYIYVGLFGYIGVDGSVERLCVWGDVSYTGNGSNITYHVGSIAGRNSGVIKNCYTMASVSGKATISSSLVSVGGIAGQSAGMIENCYASGDVFGEATSNTYVGGIVGNNIISGTIRNCVALNGDINRISGIGGGFGRITGGAIGTRENNYGSRTMTENSVPGSWSDSAGGIDGADCDAKPPEAWWKDRSTINLGWNWSSIWDLVDGEYPTF